MKHTPGPYIALDNFIYSMHIDQHMKQVADCDTAETAEFLSAAPDLLAALESLFEHCAMIHNQWGDKSNARQADESIAAARAAIKKAKGE
jgi:hypothetical protein